MHHAGTITKLINEVIIYKNDDGETRAVRIGKEFDKDFLMPQLHINQVIRFTQQGAYLMSIEQGSEKISDPPVQQNKTPFGVWLLIILAVVLVPFIRIYRRSVD